MSSATWQLERLRAAHLTWAWVAALAIGYSLVAWVRHPLTLNSLFPLAVGYLIATVLMHGLLARDLMKMALPDARLLIVPAVGNLSLLIVLSRTMLRGYHSGVLLAGFDELAAALLATSAMSLLLMFVTFLRLRGAGSQPAEWHWKLLTGVQIALAVALTTSWVLLD